MKESVDCEFTAYLAEKDCEIENGVLIKNRKEFEVLILCFENNVKIHMTEEDQSNYPDISELLNSESYESSNIRWTYREAETVVDLIDRIPIPKEIQQKLYDQEKKINQEYVHKKQSANVLLSESEKVGNMFCFKGFHDSPEIVIDHESDHLQGICIFEVVRQAGIAAAHLLGTPLTGVIIIVKSLIEYHNFIEFNIPFLIKTIPVGKPNKGGLGYIVFDVIQNNVSCVKGYFTGFMFKDKASYERFTARLPIIKA